MSFINSTKSIVGCINSKKNKLISKINHAKLTILVPFTVDFNLIGCRIHEMQGSRNGEAHLSLIDLIVFKGF